MKERPTQGVTPNTEPLQSCSSRLTYDNYTPLPLTYDNYTRSLAPSLIIRTGFQNDLLRSFHRFPKATPEVPLLLLACKTFHFSFSSPASSPRPPIPFQCPYSMPHTLISVKRNSVSFPKSPLLNVFLSTPLYPLFHLPTVSSLICPVPRQASLAPLP
jgi:hypothetical protein